MFKKKLYSIIPAFYRQKTENGKINVIIETNDYYNEKCWKTALKNFSDKYNFIFSSNRFEIYRNIPLADAFFAFGLNTSFDLSNLKMIYFASSDETKLVSGNPVVYSSKGISRYAIAEYCLGMSYCLISGFRGIVINNTSRDWLQPVFRKYGDLKLSENVIGIAGLGNNGIAIREIFRKNGCRIIGTDPDKSKKGYVDVFYDSLHEMLPDTDILILAIGAGPGTKEIIKLAELKMMKKESVLINISRGSILNEDDLYIALKKRIISAAALDVVKKEPLSPRSRLWKLNNIIITPHISGNVNMFTDEIMSDFTSKLNENFDV